MNNLEAIEEIELQESDEIAGCNCLGCAVGVLCAGCAGCIACAFPPAAIAAGASGGMAFAATLSAATAVAVAGRSA